MSWCLVVQLAEAVDPVLADAEGHFAKHHGLVFVAEQVLRDLDLEVELLVGKVAEEDVEGFLAPAGGGPGLEDVDEFFEERRVGEDPRVDLHRGAGRLWDVGDAGWEGGGVGRGGGDGSGAVVGGRPSSLLGRRGRRLAEAER